ncbi:MAG: EamA family transporter [Actinobacteria bacterium]|nr:EamA family transporter [Actinomycetota bacterium]MSY35949.1 EamA family transporter [Actinomycetota bacterium]MTA72883.1 EamA family transporter [Actinomycetota bacterium]MTB29190.1 EamA family transporter [Actinomycetota bacterium]
MKLARLAPVVFVLLWSTGFVGAKYALPYADPFILLATRILIASLLLFAVALIGKSSISIGTDAIKKSALIGVFLHAAYLGGVFFAISQGLPAGVAAVITSLQPVFVSILAVKFLGEKLRKIQLVGLVLGLIGVVLVLGPSFNNKLPLIGIVSVFIALAGSTTATLLQKKFGVGIPLVAGTAYQYLASGILLALMAAATGGVHIEWTWHFTMAFLWLLFALSFGAILLLLWLLNNGSAASVSSLMYLVPPVTALEANLLFGEKVNTQGFLGIGVCALGVWLVMRAAN